MYISPWQEYRLAQIQDDAIQRLRREWEDQLRVELPESDDARIRELMQPLVAKLPALLLSAKPSTRSKRRGSVSNEIATSGRASTRPASAASTDSHRTHTRRTERPDEPAESRSGRARLSKPTSNQDTHDAASAANDKPPLAPRAPTQKKPKKPSSAPLTALEQVQKRKKMFAMWIKHASSCSSSGGGSSNNTPDGKRDLDDSFDEEEVNSFLNWTDTLACPNDLDDSTSFDE